jgi:hypothetical protein
LRLREIKKIMYKGLIFFLNFLAWIHWWKED